MVKKVAIGNICSLMFFSIHLFIMFLEKFKKHVFNVFFNLQINVSDIYVCNVVVHHTTVVKFEKIIFSLIENVQKTQ